jgi:DNA-binding GntR family transcriptional regulator
MPTVGHVCHVGNSPKRCKVIYVEYVSIDVYSAEPFYRQLAAIIRGMIESGELERLDPLPSESALEQEYELSRDTVRKALAVLREEGVIFTIQARGSYVGPPP